MEYLDKIFKGVRMRMELWGKEPALLPLTEMEMLRERTDTLLEVDRFLIFTTNVPNTFESRQYHTPY